MMHEYENDDYDDDDYIKDEEDDEVQGIMNVDIEKEMYPSSEDQLIAVKSSIPSPDLNCVSLYGKTSPQPNTWGDKNEESSVSKELTRVTMALQITQTHGTSEVKDCQIYTYLTVPLLNSLQFSQRIKIKIQPSLRHSYTSLQIEHLKKSEE